MGPGGLGPPNFRASNTFSIGYFKKNKFNSPTFGPWRRLCRTVQYNLLNLDDNKTFVYVCKEMEEFEDNNFEGGEYNSRRHRRSAEEIALADSVLQLNEFSLVILGPRVPDDLPKKIGFNDTFEFVGENGATYIVRHGLIFLQSLPKKGQTGAMTGAARERIDSMLKELKAEQMNEELLLGGSLLLMTCFTLVFACAIVAFIICNRCCCRSSRSSKSVRYGSNGKYSAEYQPLGANGDEA